MSSGKETWDVINLVLYPGYSVYTDSSMYIVLRLYINLPVVHTVRHITLMIKGSVRENWNLIPLILLSKQIKKVATFNSDRKKNSKQIIQILQLIILKFHNIFVYLWTESYFWKYVFLSRGFLKMKTTFLYYPRIFENPAPILTIYECVEK